MTDFSPTAGRVGRDAVFAVTGCLLVAGALVIIWAARLTVDREIYVSELGATGEPTADWFRVALLLIVAGGSLIAFAGRRIRSAAPLLRATTPAISLWVGCGFFLVASQVTCTAGCPLPYGPTFTWQDFIHTSVAVLAFAAACWAMLQVSFAVGHRALRSFSLTCGIAVAVVAGAGGILSLARFGTDVGSVLELVATTIALGWLAVFGLAVRGSSAVEERQQRVGESDELMDLVVVPVDPPHSGLVADGHEIPVLLPHDEGAFGT
ncbi:hypothetical protein BKA04_001665 [Cryobacterium mesophilum]|nr:hypothetical protein [Terrimesophilobacter mesophilus]